MGWKKNLATLVLLGFTTIAFSQKPLSQKIDLITTSSLNYSFVKKKTVEKKQVIVIDPGHDIVHKPQRIEGFAEHEITLDVSKRVKEILEEHNFEVHLTRETEKPIIKHSRKRDIKARGYLAKKKDADLFFSIHCNYMKDTEKKGMEILYYGFSQWKYINNGRGDFFKPKDTKYGSLPSRERALHMKKYLETKVDIPITVKGSDLLVLKRNYRDKKELNRKSLLFEMGYLSNPQERYFMTTFPDYYAQLIADYIINNFPKAKEFSLKRLPTREITLFENELPQVKTTIEYIPKKTYTPKELKKLQRKVKRIERKENKKGLFDLFRRD